MCVGEANVVRFDDRSKPVGGRFDVGRAAYGAYSDDVISDVTSTSLPCINPWRHRPQPQQPVSRGSKTRYGRIDMVMFDLSRRNRSVPHFPSCRDLHGPRMTIARLSMARRWCYSVNIWDVAEWWPEAGGAGDDEWRTRQCPIAVVQIVHAVFIKSHWTLIHQTGFPRRLLLASVRAFSFLILVRRYLKYVFDKNWRV